MKIFKVDLDKRRDMILNGNVFKSIWILTLPTFMMALVQVLIPFSDGLFLNKILGTNVGAAVSYIQPAINILIGASQGIGVVAMAMIGKLNGKGDDEGVKKLILQILVFALSLGILLMPICFIFAEILAPADEIIRENVILYFKLSSLILPFLFMTSIFNSIKSAIGEPEATFYRMIILLLLKLFFNKIFLINLKLGLKGVIFASLCAYIFTFIWMSYDLFIKDYKFKLNIKEYKFDKKVVKELIRLSIPTSLTYITISLGFLLINFEVVIYGADVLAGLSIASQINNICFMVPSCIGTTVTTMISINIGRNNVKKSKEIYYKALLISQLVSFIVLVLILLIAKDLVKFYDPSFNVEKITLEALYLYTYSVFPFSIFTICQSVYNALGKNIYALIMGIFRIWILRYIFILITSSYLGYFSVFYGNLFSNFVAGIIYFIIILKSNWRSNIKYEG